MGNEILGNLLEKANSFTFHMKSGRVWTFKSDDVVKFEFDNGVVAVRTREDGAYFFTDMEIESVHLELKEEEKSDRK